MVRDSLELNKDRPVVQNVNALDFIRHVNSEQVNYVADSQSFEEEF